MVLHVVMIGAFVFIVFAFCVPAAKNYVKQSQLAQAGWPGANDLIRRNRANFEAGPAVGTAHPTGERIVRNKANLQTAVWTLTAG
jgi:hypothetical protein